MVIGAGLAGRMAALAASDRAQVLLVTDGPLDRCNSIMAQGGLHVPDPDPDSIASMVGDIERSARIPIDRDRAHALAEGAVETLQRLLDWGLEIDRGADGRPRRLLAGGMSAPRVVTIGDTVGPPLLKLLERRLDVTRVEIRTRVRVTDLASSDDRAVLTLSGNQKVEAGAVVIATGGDGFEFSREHHLDTTNPRNENGHLLTRLRLLGIATVHDDLWQYQPFGLVDGPKGPPRVCIPETLASSGPRLLDHEGEILVPLPNDRLTITRAMIDHMEDRGLMTPNGRGFRLTLSDIPKSVIETSYPKTARTLTRMAALGHDVIVAPFLHYQLGGIRVDVDGRTSLPRVFAAGEVTGGLHGQNRLMGAGITDALVFGWRAGIAASDVAIASSTISG